MSKIAILDTDISPKHLQCGKFHTYNVCGEKNGKWASEASHGTICAKVLDYFTSDYELFSVQIMEDSGKMTEKPMGDILHLEKGLRLCLELDVDIVCMSSVSSILSDSNIIYSAAKELSQKSVLVAALDNKKYVTVPAAYPFVAGVQSDMKDFLNPGELAYKKQDLFYAGLYANCNIGLLKEFGCSPSNSFAVPAAAAKINDWKNQGKHIATEIQNLNPYPAYGIKEEIFFKRGLGFCRELPLAVLYASEKENVYASCQRAMDRLYAKYQVQSAALCSKEDGEDVRFRKRDATVELKQELLFVECCYKTDLIFLMIEKRERNQVMEQINADLEIILRGDTICILYEGVCAKGREEDMADLVYGILQ